MFIKIKKYIPKKLKHFVKARFLAINSFFVDGNNLTFSQGGEDRILNNIFHGKRNGFYVDIGAFNPIILSNTYYFYRFLGWSGINIDAMPGSMKQFNKIRKRDINLEMGISLDDRPLTFNIIDELNSMNSFSLDYLQLQDVDISKVKKIEVKTQKLSDVLTSYVPEGKVIDFMTIDCEGLDYDILCSNNWDRFKPKAICIEIVADNIDLLKTNKSYNFLLNEGYKPVAVTYLESTLKNVIFSL